MQIENREKKFGWSTFSRGKYEKRIDEETDEGKKET